MCKIINAPGFGPYGGLWGSSGGRGHVRFCRCWAGRRFGHLVLDTGVAGFAGITCAAAVAKPCRDGRQLWCRSLGCWRPRSRHRRRFSRCRRHKLGFRANTAFTGGYSGLRSRGRGGSSCRRRRSVIWFADQPRRRLLGRLDDHSAYPRLTHQKNKT